MRSGRALLGRAVVVAVVDDEVVVVLVVVRDVVVELVVDEVVGVVELVADPEVVVEAGGAGIVGGTVGVEDDAELEDVELEAGAVEVVDVIVAVVVAAAGAGDAQESPRLTSVRSSCPGVTRPAPISAPSSAAGLV